MNRFNISKITSVCIYKCQLEKKSVHVMARCCQTTNHKLNQCWPSSVTPYCIYGIEKLPWILAFHGAPGNIQGNLDMYTYGAIRLQWPEGKIKELRFSTPTILSSFLPALHRWIFSCLRIFTDCAYSIVLVEFVKRKNHHADEIFISCKCRQHNVISVSFMIIKLFNTLFWLPITGFR